MSTRWGLLLRGVNVGGVKVTSAALRESLSTAGFADVRTVLASGNALVTDASSTAAGATAATVRARAEAALLATFDREVRVIVRTQEELAAVAAACPYASDSTTHHAYVVFFADREAASASYEQLGAALADPPGREVDADEQIALGDGVVYWWCPRGSSLSTPVSKATDKHSRGVLTTTRNLRTVLRLTAG
ncbi:pyridoxamine 5-phosphate oxidase [Serinibacter arcticus]|uniref:Pyridoxamine 5-phosphate oxidase n=1 Tax=Serinibacter arcticus TaxID=1655435 RepID=A0A2U1ZRU0_9MICO|nr:DUF1697 domain-containing protein [Serinibacter arcticus]PWD49698.1 pyridoxamine 5-phosphate oxidase [Serinibacter arcticus]